MDEEISQHPEVDSSPQAEESDTRDEARDFKFSPTLQDLPSAKLPKQDGACQHCPGAMWFYRGESLTCFCQMMNAVSYSEESDEDKIPFLSCDGMYQSLEKMQSE